MLGRNGYETEYVELAVFGSDQEAEEALTVFLKEIEELEDYKVGNIELYKNPGAPQFLTIRQDWKSKHTIRFITDGEAQESQIHAGILQTEIHPIRGNGRRKHGG